MSINIYIYIYSPYIGVMVMGIDSAIFHQDGGVIRIRLDFFLRNSGDDVPPVRKSAPDGWKTGVTLW